MSSDLFLSLFISVELFPAYVLIQTVQLKTNGTSYRPFIKCDILRLKGMWLWGKKSEIPSLSYGLQKSRRTDDSSLQQDFLLSHYTMKKTNDSGYWQQITEGPAHRNVTESDVYETAF